MKRVLLLATLALSACTQEPEGKAVTVIEFGENGETTIRQTGAEQTEPAEEVAAKSDQDDACEIVTFEQVALTHCVADPAKNRITTALGPEGDAPYRSLAAYSNTVDKADVAFAMNAGMYDGEGKPIGYYVEESNRAKELNQADGPGNFHMKPNGVFYGTGGSWQVKTADEFYRTVGTRPEFGTQSGPMLVVDGKLHPEITDNGPSKAIRNGVGVDKAGRAHFVISNSPLSFGQLARYFRDELKTPNALFLDGNVSSLWNPASGRLDKGVPIGPLIVVTRKQP